MEPQTIGNSGLYALEKNKKNNFKFILGFIVLIVVIFGVYLVFTNTTGAKKISGLEVAVKINSFLDTTLKEGGGMDAGMVCFLSTKKCTPLIVKEDQPHLGQAIYSYYLLGEVTKDKSYRQKADSAMNFVLDKCKTNKNMCAWNFFPLARYYFDTNENKYLESMLVPADDFLALSDKDVTEQNVGHKLASLYKATKDEKYKKRLLEVADNALLSWEPAERTYTGNEIQLVWSVFLPAYDITQDKKYLEASQKFFDVFKMAKNFEIFKGTDPIIKGVDALITLSEISENGSVYKTEAHNILQSIMYNLWDNQENSKLNGDYGFMEITDQDKPVIKKTLTNGWISKSFIRLSKDKFILPIKEDDKE